MSVFAWPANVLPATTDWQYYSPSEAAISPFDGDLTIVGKPGDRWSCNATFSPIVNKKKRQDFLAWLARMRHQEHQFMLPAHFYMRNGTFQPINVAPNKGLFESIGPWTGVSANAFTESRMLCVRNVSAAAGQARSGAITVEASSSYLIRVECMRGSAASFKVFIGTSAGGTQLLDSGAISQGVYTGRISTAGNTAIHVTLVCNTTVDGDFCYFDQIVIERCARIATGAYTSPRDNIVVSDMPATQFGLLEKADMIEFNGELKILLHGLNTKGDGTGYLTFSPPSRTAIAANTPVVIGSPCGRFVVTGDPTRFSTRGFFDTSFSLTLVEDIST